MPRAKLIRSPNRVYHVSARSNNKEWFYIPASLCWGLMTEALGMAADKYGAEIHTFVLMSNHYHCLLTTPRANLDLVMQYFHTRVTFLIQRATGRINHVLGARYSQNLLYGASDLAYLYKYVFRNPVRAGICERVQDYPYSTFNNLSPSLPVSEGIGPYWRAIPKNEGARLKWLNAPTSKELEELITLGLKHPRFEFSTSSNLQAKLRRLRHSYGVET